MASSWGNSWLLSWGYSWGAGTPTPPAQTGGAGYWSPREIRRKKRKHTLMRDIERTYESLEKTKEQVKQAEQVIAQPVQSKPIPKPDLAPMLAQMRLYQDRLVRLQALVDFLERQQDEEDVMILLQSLPFMSIQ